MPMSSAMYQAFVPLQIQCLSDFSTLIPGALDIVASSGRAAEDGRHHRLFHRG